MSFLSNAKVGTKLIISSGAGILLIIGMIINQQMSSAAITGANAAVAHFVSMIRCGRVFNLVPLNVRCPEIRQA
jgi:hypothetical protein